MLWGPARCPADLSGQLGARAGRWHHSCMPASRGDGVAAAGTDATCRGSKLVQLAGAPPRHDCLFDELCTPDAGSGQGLSTPCVLPHLRQCAGALGNGAGNGLGSHYSLHIRGAPIHHCLKPVAVLHPSHGVPHACARACKRCIVQLRCPPI